MGKFSRKHISSTVPKICFFFLQLGSSTSSLSYIHPVNFEKIKKRSTSESVLTKLLEGISMIMGVINLNFSCRFFFFCFILQAQHFWSSNNCIKCEKIRTDKFLSGLTSLHQVSVQMTDTRKKISRTLSHLPRCGKLLWQKHRNNFTWNLCASFS